MPRISKVLVVDDEPDIRRIAQLCLQLVEGWTVLLASSGAEALPLCANERPDLVLLDVMMPILDGKQTLEALRADAASASVPVIFMTAKAQREELDHLVSLGALGVIVKPFDPMTLALQIRQLAGELA